MNCADVRHEFSALLDGELTPETRAAVEAHLSECSDCLRELDKIKPVDALYRALPRQQAPDDFEKRVRTSGDFPGTTTEEKPTVIQFRSREQRVAAHRVWPLLAAATVLVILGGILLQMDSQNQRFKMASKSEEAESPTTISSSSLKEENVQRVSDEEIKQQLRALGYLGPDTDGVGKGDATDTLVKEVSENPQSVGDITRENGSRQERASKFDDSAAISGLKKTEEKQRARIGVPAKTLPAEAPPAAQSPSPMAYDLAAASAEKDYRGVDDAEPGNAKAKTALPGTIAPAETPLAEVAQEPKPPQPTMPMLESPAPRRTQKDPKPVAAAPMPRPRDMDKNELDEGASDPALSVGRAANFAEMPEEEQIGEEQIVGDRLFELRENTWVEKGYEGEKTVSVYRNSESLRQLIERHSELSTITTLGDRVIFRLEEKWYRIEPPPVQ